MKFCTVEGQTLNMLGLEHKAVVVEVEDVKLRQGLLQEIYFFSQPVPLIRVEVASRNHLTTVLSWSL